MPTGFPHQAEALEAKLPRRVAGRSLTTWSLRGADVLGLGQASPEDRALVELWLAGEGLTLDDVTMAFAGRSDVDRHPPYAIIAYRFGTMPARELPLALGIPLAAEGTWSRARISGKSVQVGSVEMLEQTVHLRGYPTVYNTGVFRFVVTTDDKVWLADALRQLP